MRPWEQNHCHSPQLFMRSIGGDHEEDRVLVTELIALLDLHDPPALVCGLPSLLYFLRGGDHRAAIHSIETSLYSHANRGKLLEMGYVCFIRFSNMDLLVRLLGL